MDLLDPRAKLVGRVRYQSNYRITDSDRPEIASNVEKLRHLRIMLSSAAQGTLAEIKGANPVLALILSIVDLQPCKSAQEAVKLINKNRADAMTRSWFAFEFKSPLPEEFSLTELGTPTARYKYVLDTKLSILRFEEDPAKTRRP